MKIKTRSSATILICCVVSFSQPQFIMWLPMDDNQAGSLSAPWQTIQHAANQMKAGDTVQVRAGIYHETVRTTRDGRADSYIVYSAFPAERRASSTGNPVRKWGGKLINLTAPFLPLPPERAHPDQIHSALSSGFPILPGV